MIRGDDDAAGAVAEPPAPRPFRLAHWVVGAAGVLGFLCSGLYMKYHVAHLDGLDRATRLSFRSIHIYLLFSSLLNLAVASHARLSARRWAVGAARVGSLLLLAAPPLLGAAFIREPLVPSLDRELTRFGVYASAGGIVLLSLGQLGSSRPRPPLPPVMRER